MVYLTRLDGSELVINAEHIVAIERTPDTVLTLTTGARVMVKDTVSDVVDRVVFYRRKCLAGPVVLVEPRQGQE